MVTPEWRTGQGRRARQDPMADYFICLSCDMPNVLPMAPMHAPG